MLQVSIPTSLLEAEMVMTGALNEVLEKSGIESSQDPLGLSMHLNSFLLTVAGGALFIKRHEVQQVYQACLVDALVW